MQFLTLALMLSAHKVTAQWVFGKVEGSAWDIWQRNIGTGARENVKQFKTALHYFTAEKQTTFVEEVDANCTFDVVPTKIEDLVAVIAKLKLVESNPNAKRKLATSLKKLQVCQDNLVKLYDTGLENKESAETVRKWFILLDDDDLKAKLIEKNLVWLKIEAEKSREDQSQTLVNKARKYLRGPDHESHRYGNWLEDWVIELFQAFEKNQEREAALNVLDAIYKEKVNWFVKLFTKKNVIIRPTTDLVRGLVSIENFKEIMAAKSQLAYEEKIEDITTEITKEILERPDNPHWMRNNSKKVAKKEKERINNFLAILKDVHANLINSDSEKSYIVQHRTLLKEADVSTYFLKEVLMTSKRYQRKSSTFSDTSNLLDTASVFQEASSSIIGLSVLLLTI